MIQNHSLPELLKTYLKRIVERPETQAYLAYRPASGLWAFFDATLVDDVWAAFTDVGIVTVLRLEPAAAAALLESSNLSDIEGVITKYATFNAPRPHQIGLQNFVEVEAPTSTEGTPPDTVDITQP